MKFVILGWDGPDGQKLRPTHRPAHLEGLQRLEAQGRLICAGPFGDQTGSLIIIEADSLQDAESVAREDPYMKYRVFDRVEVHPFTHVLPKIS